MIQNFILQESYGSYDFGPKHPLRPGRVTGAVQALEGDVVIERPDPFDEDDLLRIHDLDYVEFCKVAYQADPDDQYSFGFSEHDTPPFPGMFQAALDVVASSATAAKRVNQGAKRAFSMSGGLHHAMRFRGGGFCVLNDVAMACAVLREKHERVMYVDIDLHHGDGVQQIFYDDPAVITYSIHESGRTLWPGTGFVEETGANYSAINLPMAAYTTGDVWLDAFKQTFQKAIEVTKPQAIVLQMGADPHITDPLGHLQVSIQHWLGAVKLVHETGLPVVATGGGGYDLRNVPRAWSSAIRVLSDMSVKELLPEGMVNPWGTRDVFDPEDRLPSTHGQEEAERVTGQVLANLGALASAGSGNSQS